MLFWSLDRFSCEGVLETLLHLQRLNSYGVEWFRYREEYLRSVGVYKVAVARHFGSCRQTGMHPHSGARSGRPSTSKGARQDSGRPKANVRYERVRTLRERGVSLRAIPKQTGVSAMTVQRFLASQSSPPSLYGDTCQV